jgi:hypothetical protein
MSLANTLRTDLAHANTTNLPCLDILRNVADRVLDGYFRINSRTLKDVEKLLAIKHTQTLVDASLDIGSAAIDSHLGRFHASFDRDDNFLRILGVFGEIVVEEMA